MWYIFPQVDLGKNKTYAIFSKEEARAYLAHPILGPRLRESVALVMRHSHKSPEAIFGGTDSKKFRSCLTLFAAASTSQSDKALFEGALNRFYNGRSDGLTKRYLKLDRSISSDRPTIENPRRKMRKTPYVKKVIADTEQYWFKKRRHRNRSSDDLMQAFYKFNESAEKIYKESGRSRVESDLSTGPLIKNIVHETFDAFVNRKNPNALTEFEERYRSVLTTGRDRPLPSKQHKEPYVFKVIADTANYWSGKGSRADLSRALKEFSKLAEKIYFENKPHHRGKPTGPAIKRIVHETFKSFINGNPSALKEFEERYRSLLTTGQDRPMQSSFTYKPYSGYGKHRNQPFPPAMKYPSMRSVSIDPFINKLRKTSRGSMWDLKNEKTFFGEVDSRLVPFIDGLLNDLKRETQKLERSIPGRSVENKEMAIREMDRIGRGIVEKARAVTALCKGSVLRASPELIERIFDGRIQLSDKIAEHLHDLHKKGERKNLGMAKKHVVQTGKVLAGNETGTHCLVEAGRNTLRLVEPTLVRDSQRRRYAQNSRR